LLAVPIHLKDDHLNLVADLDQFTRVVDAFGPRHFTDMHQAFDARFELHKRTVAHHVHHRAGYLRADRIVVCNVVPRVRLFLLQAKGDLLFLAIDMQDHDLDFLIDRDHFRGMTDTFPAHICNVEQAINATEVDEGAEVSDVLDHTLAQLVDFQFTQQLFAVFLALLLDERSAADHDVAASFIDFQYLALHHSANIVANVAGAADVHLAGRQEHVDADIDQETAFDLARDGSRHHLTLLHGLHHLFPLQDLLSFALAEPHHAVRVVGHAELVFHLLDQDLDRFANLGLLALSPLVARNRSFTLIAFSAVNTNDAPVHDLVDVKIAFRLYIRHNHVGGVFQCRLKDGLKIWITFQTADEVSIYHCTLNLPFTPMWP